jgi:hypothetical protein
MILICFVQSVIRIAVIKPLASRFGIQMRSKIKMKNRKPPPQKITCAQTRWALMFGLVFGGRMPSNGGGFAHGLLCDCWNATRGAPANQAKEREE